MFNLSQDKIYIGFILLVILGAVIFGTSAYVKNCVKTELDEIKEETRKKKRIIMMRRQMEERRIQQQEMQMKLRMQEEQANEQEQDMESYVDPTRQQNHVHNMNDNILGFNSEEFDTQAIGSIQDVSNGMSKENVLMRDLVDGTR
jgi:hypothetical protein